MPISEYRVHPLASILVYHVKKDNLQQPFNGHCTGWLTRVSGISKQ